MNPKVFDRYEIVRRLNAGGMGEIFLGRQVGMAGFDRLVILKSILPEHASDPDVLDQFLNEARIIGCINHPNVIAVYEVGEWQGTYFMAMEYVDGVDLAEIVLAAGEAGHTLTPRFAASVGKDAALGLDYAHHAVDANGNPLGVIHRDVTPHNIMVRRDGVVKVVDFGVARAANRRKKTETGILKGKLGYFAPEQVEAEDIDARADQFVLGVVLWELLTGRRAFPGENTGLVLRRIASSRLPRASTLCLVAPELDDVVWRMTALSPAERFPRCADAAAALQTFLNTTPGDPTEVASTVMKLFGKSLDERAAQLRHEVVQLEGRTLTIPKVAVPPPAEKPEKRGREAVIDLERASEAPVAVHGGRMRDSSFREIELDLGSDAKPLEVGRTGRFSLESAAIEAEIELDEITPRVEEPVRDEITVVWCELGALAPEDRETLMAALRASAKPVGATFAAVDAGVVCVFGTRHLRNEHPEQGVRLACELLSIVDDWNGARPGLPALAVRVGVATGLSPERDARGACEPTLQDTAVDRARRLALVAAPGRVMVAQDTQRFTGKRIRYAAEMRTLIDQWTAPFVASEVAGFGTPPPSVGVHGRDEAVAAVVRVVHAAARRRPDGVVLVGEPGIGKTLLLDEAERVARFKTLAVARASCGRSVAPAPLDVLRQLVRSLTDDVTARMSDDASSERAPQPSSLDDPSGAITLGTPAAVSAGPAASGSAASARNKKWVAALKNLGLAPGDVRRLRVLLGERGAEGTLPLARRRALLRGAVTALFRAVAEQIGLCFLIDDAHAIDGPSWTQLGTVLPLLAHARFGLVATARTGVSDRLFPRLARVALGPLPPDAVAHVALRAAFDVPLPAAALDVVRERAGGNPTKAWLATRALIAGGAVDRMAAGYVLRVDPQRIALPASIPELVHALAATLSPAARAFLRLAANVGDCAPARAFSPSLPSPEAASVALIEAVATDLVTQPPGVDAVVFRSPSVREALAALSTERDKGIPPLKNLHAAVAEALVIDDGVEDRALRADQIASHAAVGDAKELVAAWAERSAAYHAACGGSETAADAYQRALVALYKSTGRGTALSDEQAAAVLDLVGATIECMADVDPVQACDFFVPLLKELPRTLAPPARARAERQRARVLLQLGRTSEAERALDDALELCPPDRDREEAAQILSALAEAFEMRGNVPSAITQLAQALRVVEGRKLADVGFAWNNWLHLARLRAQQKDPAGAREALAAARSAATLAKSARGLAEVDAALARIVLAAGAPDEAQQLLDDAAARWLAFGDRAAAARCLQGAGTIAMHAARVDDAAERLRRALELAAAADWQDGVTALRAALATLE